MNILYVQDTDWIEKNPIQHNHLAERMVKKGHVVKVIDFELNYRKQQNKQIFSKRKTHKISRMLPDAYHEVIRPPFLRLPLLDYLSMFYFYRKEINRQIHEFKPDVIIADGIITPFLAFHLAKKHHIKTVYYCIDLDYKLIPQLYLQPIGRLIESMNISKADRVISINEALREYTIRMGAKRDNTEVIRAGVNKKMFNPEISGEKIRKTYGIGKEDTLLFFVGWLYHFSGLKEVIKELAHCKRDDIKLLIVGDGDAYDDLKQLIEEYNVTDKVFMIGKKPYNELPEYLAAADICILPAYNNEIMRDIVPIKMYEYMAMGNPVIATKLHGLISEFGVGNGIIYEDSPEKVVNSAIEIINKGTIRIEGNKSKKHVESLDWGRLTNQLQQSLEMVKKNG